ncbi:MAG: cytidylate kinase family protein [Symbiobacteriaceae bacterium]|nr:cytidylate kinase family protein [Symbiobacteriaceae bacterium]
MSSIHITITGNLGSGKSTLCRLLHEQYGFTRYSTGDVQRQLAQKMGMTTLELNLFMQSDSKHDKLIDDEVVRIATVGTKESIIFDSRMAWHFVPHSFKVFLTVDIEVAATRIYTDDNRGKVEHYNSIWQTGQHILQRAASERERFQNFYGEDYFDLSHYDLVIDTCQVSPQQLAEIILQQAEQFYASEQEYQSQVLLYPGTIYPGPVSAAMRSHLASRFSQFIPAPHHIYAQERLPVLQHAGCFFLAAEDNLPLLIDLTRSGVAFATVELLNFAPEVATRELQELVQHIRLLSPEDIAYMEQLTGHRYLRFPWD